MQKAFHQDKIPMSYFAGLSNEESEQNMEDILNALRDKNKARLLRHHIVNVCSEDNSDVVSIFCQNLLRAYLTASITLLIDDVVEKNTDKLYLRLYDALNR